MEIISNLLHSSPAEAVRILSGLGSGAILLSALALSSTFRRVAVFATAAGLLYLLYIHGPKGVEALVSGLLVVMRKHELFLKGMIAGKVVAAAVWQRQAAAKGAQR